MNVSSQSIVTTCFFHMFFSVFSATSTSTSTCSPSSSAWCLDVWMLVCWVHAGFGSIILHKTMLLRGV